MRHYQPPTSARGCDEDGALFVAADGLGALDSRDATSPPRTTGRRGGAGGHWDGRDSERKARWRGAAPARRGSEPVPVQGATEPLQQDLWGPERTRRTLKRCRADVPAIDRCTRTSAASLPRSAAATGGGGWRRLAARPRPRRPGGGGGRRRRLLDDGGVAARTRSGRLCRRWNLSLLRRVHGRGSPSQGAKARMAPSLRPWRSTAPPPSRGVPSRRLPQPRGALSAAASSPPSTARCWWHAALDATGPVSARRVALSVRQRQSAAKREQLGRQASSVASPADGGSAARVRRAVFRRRRRAPPSVARSSGRSRARRAPTSLVGRGRRLRRRSSSRDARRRPLAKELGGARSFR